MASMYRPSSQLIPYMTWVPRMRVGTIENERDAASSILQRLAACRLTPHPSSRLATYARVIQDEEWRSRASYKFQHTLDADLDEWDRITSSLPLENKYWRKKALCSLGGQPDIYASGFSYARDTQFELYAAACMREAKFKIVVPSPGHDGAGVDFEIVASRYRMGIEAKRVASPSKILLRLKEAESQLRRARIPGLIALDMSRAIQADLTPNELAEPEAIQPIYSAMKDHVYGIINEFAATLDKNFVLAVWVFCRRCFILPPRSKPFGMVAWYPIKTVPSHDPRHRILVRLMADWLLRDTQSRSTSTYKGPGSDIWADGPVIAQGW